MKIGRITVVAASMALLAIGLVAGIFVGMKRGVPFVAQREQWTIGIYRGESPLDFSSAQRRNPVLRAEDVTDVTAKFVADPFLIRDEATWYLFFEVYNLTTDQGDLAFATSSNTRNWKYGQVIIDEPFHLSYPYIFEWGNDYYLIPESNEAGSIRLYRATDFPVTWQFEATLLDDRPLVDPSIIHFNDRWWLFATTLSNDTLHLFYAEDLLGPWLEHPQSPIVEGDLSMARSSGRITEYEDRLYRFTMEINPDFGGRQVWGYEITDLSPATYAERRVGDQPILRPSGKGWNARQMHQLDPREIAPGEWVAAVDGFGNYYVFGLQY